MLQKISVEPKISLNKLGEYMVASPSRRKSILVDQKHPRDFITTRYRAAYSAISEYLCRGRDQQVFVKYRSRLRAGSFESEHEIQNAGLCLEAIAAFEDLKGDLRIEHCKAKRPGLRLPNLVRSGVRISVRPDVILYGVNNRGKPYLGAIKYCFSKTRVVDEREAAYVGAVLRHYMARFANEEQEVLSHFCMVVDVFARRVHAAPRAHKQRLADVTAACEEIAARWPQL